MDHPNISQLIADVSRYVPDIKDPSVRVNTNGASGYFVCTLREKMRVVFWERLSYGMWVALKTDEQIAIEIARELR